MSRILEFTAREDDSGVRLDVFLSKNSELSRSHIQDLIKKGMALVNNNHAKANHTVKKGDSITFEMPDPKQAKASAEDIPIEIIYQDGDIAIINKPKGMVVHPAAGNLNGTLVNALLFHMEDLAGIGGELRPGIVHRLDKDTSGLLMIAKNDAAHASLSNQLKEHSASRRYLAIVEGHMRNEQGTIDAPIARHPVHRKKMAVAKTGGRAAVTHWKRINEYNGFTLVECKLETGRTHQIRVHMASIGHPVAGDTVYGSKKPKLGLTGQALHAFSLTLTHPATGTRMTFEAPLPDYFRSVLEKLSASE